MPSPNLLPFLVPLAVTQSAISQAWVPAAAPNPKVAAFAEYLVRQTAKLFGLRLCLKTGDPNIPANQVGDDLDESAFWQRGVNGSERA